MSSKLLLIQSNLIMVFAATLLFLDKDIHFSQKYCFISCSILLLVFSIFKGYIDAEEINKGKASYKIEFIYNNQQYNSNSENLFLGKTHEYLFIYNKKNKLTQIFKTSEVSDLKIKKL